MTLPIYQVDAFTSKIFAGNPAAVCPLSEWIAPELMQKIAAENNLAETAFFVQREDEYEIRWFMPHDEIDLCGHATLASAFVIFNYLNPELKEISFSSKSGILKAFRGGNNVITLDFPSRVPTNVDIPEEIFEAFNHAPTEAHAGRDLVLLFESEQHIRELNPNLQPLKDLPYLGIIATAKGDEADFVSRVFDANCPMPEDPVTGSAHCHLVPFWAERLKKKTFRALQLSERGGELFCELEGDRVFIGGHAVSFLQGEIFV